MNAQVERVSNSPVTNERSHRARWDRHRQRQQRRSEIIPAAGNAFSECGYDHASMLLLAERAEVAKPTRDAYVRGKSGLLDAVIEYWMAAAPTPKLDYVDGKTLLGSTDKLAIGPSCRSEIDDDLPGSVDWTVPGHVAGVFAASSTTRQFFRNVAANADPTTPSTTSVDMRYAFADRFALMAPWSETGWSSLREVRVDFADRIRIRSSPSNGAIAGSRRWAPSPRSMRTSRCAPASLELRFSETCPQVERLRIACSGAESSARPLFNPTPGPRQSDEKTIT